MKATTPSAGRGPAARRAIGAALWRIAATALAGGLISATLVRFSPGFGLDERQLDSTVSAQSQEILRHSHDRERDLPRFYAGYLRAMLRGDLGNSVAFGRPIRELLAERAPLTAGLMIAGAAGAWTLAWLLAIPAAALRSPWPGAASGVLSSVPASVPAAGIAILLFRVGASPVWGIALVLFPKIYQCLHTLLRQSYAMPHVLLARAKGLRGYQIFLRHVLPVARAPLLALIAVSINLAFGASVAIEAVSDLPGLGQLAWKGAVARDLPLLVVLTLGIALVTQVSNLVADILSPAGGRTR